MKCKHCGFTKRSHERKDFFKKVKINMIFADKLNLQPCKKFEAETDEEIAKNIVTNALMLARKRKSQQKGCGKIIEVLNEPDIKIVCGRDYYGTNFNGKWINKELALHPSCSGNHTRQKSNSDRVVGVSPNPAEKEPDVTSGSDFDLSEERKKLLRQIMEEFSSFKCTTSKVTSIQKARKKAKITLEERKDKVNKVMKGGKRREK